MPPHQIAHLEPSELGTKEYWDSFYSNDLSSPPSPTASLDGWFSDVKAASKIVNYLLDDLQTQELRLDARKTTFLDLGTGNGEMLFHLREEGGFKGYMLGVDYSAPSIELARRLAIAKGLEEIEFEHWNIVQDPLRKKWYDGFDVVLDKGTFDAISMSDEMDERGRRLCEGYKERVEKLVKPNGYFLITSCNWTKPELVEWFTNPDERNEGFEIWGEVKYPDFVFGGRVGQSVTSLCFKKP